jgi:ubiquinone/menaquinone biosynthesis C-methylase UbiE
MQFKDHFSGHADSYREARPRYPAALFDWLARQCATHERCWDVGCGNGQASLGLAEHFDEVYATDPSAAQIENAMVHPRVRYAVEPGEHCGLPDASVDLVSIAQALHWLDHARFLAELPRVAKSGAFFAAYGYPLAQVTPAVDAVVYELYEPVLGACWPPERAHIEQHYASIAFPFATELNSDFAMVHEWGMAQYAAYIETWSALQRYRKSRGADPFQNFLPKLRAAWGDAAVRTVRWPLFVRYARL